MKKYTVDEKVKHHETIPMYSDGKFNDRWEFGIGYDLAVTLYRGYIKADKETRRITDEIIATNKELAKQGDKVGKGFMCGMRDAANERKTKKKK